MSEQEETEGVPVLIVTLSRTEQEQARLEFFMSPVMRVLEDGFMLDFAAALEGYAKQLRSGDISNGTLN